MKRADIISLCLIFAISSTLPILTTNEKISYREIALSNIAFPNLAEFYSNIDHTSPNLLPLEAGYDSSVYRRNRPLHDSTVNFVKLLKIDKEVSESVKKDLEEKYIFLESYP